MWAASLSYKYSPTYKLMRSKLFSDAKTNHNLGYCISLLIFGITNCKAKQKTKVDSFIHAVELVQNQEESSASNDISKESVQNTVETLISLSSFGLIEAMNEICD